MSRLINFFVFTLLLITSVGVAFSAKSSAISSASWKAGYIIDDSLMYNASDATPGSINSFLVGKVPTCDTNGTQPYAGTTRASYGASRGYPAPYTCLKDYSENVTARSADSYCKGIVGGTKSSASIIYEVAQSCNISAKVLLVMLEKEQGLISDDWPWSLQYRGAMGYGCPDTAACDSQYYGFFNQVYNAARQFKVYAANQSSYRYKPYQTNFIQWNPNSGCGGSNVYIENRATAGLYNYTPYQPNSAALNNLYGTGDSCSAYGNRNFWRLYSDWFGSTTGKPYQWEVSGVYEVYNEAGNVRVDPGYLEPGYKYTVKVAAKNIGTATWFNNGSNPLLLGTNTNSGLCTAEWYACNRAALLQESSIAPGGIGHFQFKIQAPYKAGNYYEYFKPVAEMAGWANDSPDPFGIRVVSGSYSWQLENNVYEVYNEAGNVRVDPGYLEPGQRYTVKLTARNTGTATWKNNGPTPFTFASPGNSGFCDSSWIACSRPSYLQEPLVLPGQVGHFEFKLKAPYKAGNYYEAFKPVAEFLSWTNDGPLFGVRVVSGSYSWQLENNVYEVYNEAGNVRVDPGYLTKNTRYVVKLSARNTGTATWKNNGPTPFTFASPGNSGFCDSSWIACNRPGYLKESSIGPGQVGTFEFAIKTPDSIGNYYEAFKPVAEFLSWTNDGPLFGVRTTQ